MQSVEPVLENAIKTLQKVVDVRGMGKKWEPRFLGWRLESITVVLKMLVPLKVQLIFKIIEKKCFKLIADSNFIFLGSYFPFLLTFSWLHTIGHFFSSPFFFMMSPRYHWFFHRDASISNQTGCWRQQHCRRNPQAACRARVNLGWRSVLTVDIMCLNVTWASLTWAYLWAHALSAPHHLHQWSSRHLLNSYKGQWGNELTSRDTIWPWGKMFEDFINEASSIFIGCLQIIIIGPHDVLT